MSVQLLINLAIAPYGFGLCSDHFTGIEHSQETTDMRTCEQLLIRIQGALTLLNKKITDLSSIGLILGPGSATGCRLATTLTKALAHMAGIGIFTLTTFQALLWSYRTLSGHYLVMFPASKGYVNVQFWHVKNNQCWSLTDVFQWEHCQIYDRMCQFNTPVTLLGQIPHATSLKDKTLHIIDTHPMLLPLARALSQTTAYFDYCEPNHILRMAPIYAYPPIRKAL